MLHLDDQFRITKDTSEQNFQLEKLFEIKDRKTGEIKSEYKIIGYHGSSIKSVLNQYKNEAVISDDKLESIHSVMDKLNEIDKTIERVVKKENIRLVVKDDD